MKRHKKHIVTDKTVLDSSDKIADAVCYGSVAGAWFTNGAIILVIGNKKNQHGMIKCA